MMDNFIRLPVTLDEIYVGDDRRLPEADKVAEITESIKTVGLLNPISVQMIGGEPWLIAGLHRLLALKALGEKETVAHVYEAESSDAQLMEIAENLHRAELTPLHRAEQIARWIELTVAKQQEDEQQPVEQSDLSEQQPAEQKEGVLRQLDAKPPGGRPEGGVRAAARELGISEADARRSIKVSELSPSAKTAAMRFGLHNNQSALLRAAKQSKPAQQIAVLREIHHAKQIRAANKRIDKITLNALMEAAEKGNDVSAAVQTARPVAAIKPEPVDEPDAEVDADGYYLKDEPVDQWRRSVMNMAGHHISMPAFWTREFGEWTDFAPTAEMVQLVFDAALTWSNLAVDLKRRLAGNDQQQAA